MQIKDSRFHKVWKIEIDRQTGRKKVNLGDSKKNQDGTWRNWTWAFCTLAGNAKGIQVSEGDTITIDNGKIEQYQNQSGEWRNSITIFDFTVTARGQQEPQGNSQSLYHNYPQNNQNNSRDFQDDIPF